jgi:hypothetical protein
MLYKALWVEKTAKPIEGRKIQKGYAVHDNRKILTFEFLLNGINGEKLKVTSV